MSVGKAIRELYRSSSLQQIAKQASRFQRDSSGDVQFISYQCRTIQELFPKLHIDFAVVSAVRTDKHFQTTGINCTTYNLHKSAIENYKIIADKDIISKAVYANPGRTITNETVFSDDEWSNTPLYRQHCQKYDIQKGMMVGFLYPEYECKFITFDYLSSTDAADPFDLTDNTLELITLPFALAWLYRKEAMDEAKMLTRFKAVEDLTFTKLAYVRHYVNSWRACLSSQAQTIDATPAAYKVGLYDIRDEIADRFGLYEAGDHKTFYKSLRPLDKHCDFLGMLGDTSAELIIPTA